MQALYNNFDLKSTETKILESCLRGYVTASDSKEDISRRRRYLRHIALDYCKWIEFNEDRLKVLVFDLDRNVASTLDGVYTQVLNAVDIEPTWVCMTDKGAHVAYVLENSIEYEWKKTIAIARKIKRAITKKLGADAYGSHKLKGWWRNPLIHDYYFFNNLYSLTDFYGVLDTKVYDKADKTIQQKFISARNAHKRDNGSFFNLKEGNRNELLWYIGMAETRNKNYSFDAVVALLQSIQNAENVEGLEDVELEMIARSICKYNKNGDNWIVDFKAQKWCKNRGSMGFKAIGSGGFVEPAKHASIVKKRQRASAEKTNKEYDVASRKENMKQVNENRKIRTRSKIKQALEDLFLRKTLLTKKGKPKALAIARELGLHRDTVSAHLKEMQLI